MKPGRVVALLGAAGLLAACSSGSPKAAPASPSASSSPTSSSSSSTPSSATSTLTPTSTAQPTAAYSPPATGIQGRVLFTIEAQEGPHRIAYVDGTGLHLLPRVPHLSQGSAVWDGTDHILFTGEGAGQSHVYRMALDGTHVVQLTHGPPDQDRPAVSSDLSTLAFGDYNSAVDLGVHRAAADGSQLTRLTPITQHGERAGNDEPTFSPDGRSIAYIHIVNADKGLGELWVMGADGSAPHRLTRASLGAGAPAYSPDGRNILLTSQDDTLNNHDPLLVVGSAGGTPRPLSGTAGATGVGAAWEGDWSPDGAQIVYMYYEPGWDHNELRVADADGTHVQTLWVSPVLASANAPDWSD